MADVEVAALGVDNGSGLLLGPVFPSFVSRFMVGMDQLDSDAVTSCRASRTLL